MKNAARQIRRDRGVALLLALVSVIALSVIAVGLYQASQPSWEESTLSRARYQAGLLAESGLNIALHPQIAAGDPALRHEPAPGRGWEVRITSEGGRFPVNSMTNERLRAAAVELFVLWGLDAAAASRVADSIADWIDADSDPLPNGAENPWYASVDYPQFPPNADFTSLEQLPFVAGMEALERVQPFWRDHFTIRSDGLVDFNAASREIIQAVTGATEDAAANLVSVRDGDDGIWGTPDDYVFRDTGEVQSLLGVSDAEWSDISDLVTVSGTVRRIESVGRVGDFTERRVLIAEETTENNRTVLRPLARFRE
jgi:type II secretory pathway component PulK